MERQLYGYIDTGGKLVIRPQFLGAGQFGTQSLAPVNLGGQWGYIDKKGTFKINPQFWEARPFSTNSGSSTAIIAISIGVTQANSLRYGLVDETGTYLINPQFPYMGDFDPNGLAVATVGSNAAGLINANGKFVVNPMYTQLEFIRSTGDYRFVKSAGLGASSGVTEIGRMDKNGKVLSSVRGSACRSS